MAASFLKHARELKLGNDHLGLLVGHGFLLDGRLVAVRRVVVTAQPLKHVLIGFVRRRLPKEVKQLLPLGSILRGVRKSSQITSGAATRRVTAGIERVFWRLGRTVNHATLACMQHVRRQRCRVITRIRQVHGLLFVGYTSGRGALIRCSLLLLGLLPHLVLMNNFLSCHRGLLLDSLTRDSEAHRVDPRHLGVVLFVLDEGPRTQIVHGHHLGLRLRRLWHG